MKNNFRAAREMRSLTQDEVADKLGVARPTYGRYENGQRECSFETLSKLADYLNVSTDFLLGRDTVKTPALSDEQATLLKGFDALNAAGRNVLVAVLDSLRVSHAAAL